MFTEIANFNRTDTVFNRTRNVAQCFWCSLNLFRLLMFLSFLFILDLYYNNIEYVLFMT